MPMWEGPQCPDLFVKESPHSSNLRCHRWSDVADTFFVTKSLRPKKPVLDERAREILSYPHLHSPLNGNGFTYLPSSSCPIIGMRYFC